MKKITNLFSSMTLFYVSAGLVLILCVAGGIFFQVNVFEGWPFRAALALLALNLAACTAKRRQAIFLRPGIFLTHAAALMLLLAGVAHGFFAERGFLTLEIGQAQNFYVAEDDRQVPLPFEVRLKKFTIRYWEPARHFIRAIRRSDRKMLVESAEVGKTISFAPLDLTVTPVQYYPNFVFQASGPVSRNDAPENPCLEVMAYQGQSVSRQFLFALYPDFRHTQLTGDIQLEYEFQPGRIKQFESELAITEQGRTVCDQAVRVNQPCTWRGWTFYQSGYDEKNLKVSIIQITRDPSRYAILAGFILLLTGLGWTLWLEPQRR